MSAVPTWSTLPADQLPRDPWPHERGDDLDHLLDPAGHAPHHVERTARMLDGPHHFVQRIHRPASPLATYIIGSEVVVFVMVALLALAGTLPGATA